MTTERESEILTRVGPGTPMGTLMRHYWLPALKSSELVADGEPVRFKLLGENLIAFRDMVCGSARWRIALGAAGATQTVAHGARGNAVGIRLSPSL